MRRLIFIILICILTLGSKPVLSQSQPWLSGKPPKDVSKRVRPSGMQKYYALRGKRGKESLVLWVRSGENNINSSYSRKIDTTAQVFAFGPNREEIEFDQTINDLGHIITYPFKLESFHNIYLLKKEVIDSTLYIHSAKAERMSHKCMNGHKSENTRLNINTYPEITDFEIVRNRIRFEDFHTILQAGNKLELKAIFHGKPLSGCNINVSTAKAWAKNISTAENGIAEFQLINDYFTDFKEIEKKKTFHLLLKANHKIDSIGLFQGKRFTNIVYTTNMELEYIPSKALYTSYVWGLLIFTISIFLLAVLVIFLRKRRSAKFGELF